MPSIGIMQGRLLPMVGHRIQAFPGSGWEREFELAADVGFDSIELTVEMASWDTHPVRSDAGRATLARLIERTGIAAAGLCCDTFMEMPLVSADAAVRTQATDILMTTLHDAAAAGLPMIEVPMLGENSLDNQGPDTAFDDILGRALESADHLGIDILLETDMDAKPLGQFLSAHDHRRLGVNYDMGNSTYFGYDPAVEIAAYGDRIRNVHVKDCTAADYSVPLGQGDTDFDAVFHSLSRTAYGGGFILQAARQSDDIAAAAVYLEFTRNLVKRHLGS